MRVFKCSVSYIFYIASLLSRTSPPLSYPFRTENRTPRVAVSGWRPSHSRVTCLSTPPLPPESVWRRPARSHLLSQLLAGKLLQRITFGFLGSLLKRCL